MQVFELLVSEEHSRSRSQRLQSFLHRLCRQTQEDSVCILLCHNEWKKWVLKNWDSPCSLSTSLKCAISKNEKITSNKGKTDRKKREKNERDRATATNTNMDKTVNDDLSGRKDIFRVFAHKRALCALCLIHHPGLQKGGK